MDKQDTNDDRYYSARNGQLDYEIIRPDGSLFFRMTGSHDVEELLGVLNGRQAETQRIALAAGEKVREALVATIRAEHLEDPSDGEGDAGYMQALYDAEHAIRALDLSTILNTLAPPAPYEAQIRADAARFRWLRDRPVDAIHRGGVFAGKTPDNIILNGDDLVVAVDAAIALATPKPDEAVGEDGE